LDGKINRRKFGDNREMDKYQSMIANARMETIRWILYAFIFASTYRPDLLRQLIKSSTSKVALITWNRARIVFQSPTIARHLTAPRRLNAQRSWIIFRYNSLNTSPSPLGRCVTRASKEKFDTGNVDRVTGYFISETDGRWIAHWNADCQNRD
jgi:hypothetical protein